MKLIRVTDRTGVTRTHGGCHAAQIRKAAAVSVPARVADRHRAEIIALAVAHPKLGRRTIAGGAARTPAGADHRVGVDDRRWWVSHGRRGAGRLVLRAAGRRGRAATGTAASQATV
jgi:hypothetical protein